MKSLFGLKKIAFFIAAALLPTPPANAEVAVSVGLLPPHMDEAGEGRDADILRAVIAECMGERMRLVVAPFSRHWTEYADRGRDAANTVPEGMALPGFKSVGYITYQNGAAVLSSARPVRSTADLVGRSAVTFADGTQILGLKGLRVSRLVEQADQEIHSNLLFTRRIDVVLADGMIVAEYNRRLRERTDGRPQIDAGQPVTFSAIFPPTVYHMVFRAQALQQRFDECFRKQEAEGRIATINHAYGDRYRATIGRDYAGY